MLADDYEKRVMIVDTSNEIGGDGDIPHPGIGNARRLQVPNQEMQHKVCSLKFVALYCSQAYCSALTCVLKSDVTTCFGQVRWMILYSMEHLCSF